MKTKEEISKRINKLIKEEIKNYKYNKNLSKNNFKIEDRATAIVVLKELLKKL